MNAIDHASRHHLVSAIVSTYNSEEFLLGCLEDLTAQTISESLEIIVIDSASPQNEGEIVADYQRKHGNIRYVRTDRRETLYQAWNRGIKMATGKYVTNANTDDRHRKDALEIMAQVLEVEPDVALVYADQIYTRVPNETFESTSSRKRRMWKDYSYQALRGHCLVGPQPMWRKSIHDRHGYFDESYVSAGDWEFWLRIGRLEKFKKVDEVLGLYLENPRGIENSHSGTQAEVERIRSSYNIAPSEVSRSRFTLHIPNFWQFWKLLSGKGSEKKL
jgi:glycosyltransferase involved in cell wall biosynthesis